MRTNLKMDFDCRFGPDLKYGIFSGSEGDFGSFGYGGSRQGRFTKTNRIKMAGNSIFDLKTNLDSGSGSGLDNF